MYDKIVKRLRLKIDRGDPIEVDLLIESADAIEHMQKTILRLENELGIYDDLPMVDQREPPKEEL
jgi:hypothetical protein